MPHPNEDLLWTAYDAQSRGDLDAYLECLREDFVLHIPGHSRIAGDYIGKDEVRRHFQEITQLSGGSFRTSVHDMVANDEHVVALVEAEALRAGERTLLPRVHVWHVRDGKLAELWLHPVDQDAFDDYWGPSEGARRG